MDVQTLFLDYEDAGWNDNSKLTLLSRFLEQEAEKDHRILDRLEHFLEEQFLDECENNLYQEDFPPEENWEESEDPEPEDWEEENVVDCPCGETMDKDCNGKYRCPNCDDPCPGCSDA